MSVKTSSFDKDKCDRFEWVPVGKLMVDPSYQRRRSDSAVRAIADDFNWIACGSLIVSERPNKDLSVMEGSHRLNGAIQNGTITHLPCMIWKVPTVADEARMFLWINLRRKAMKSLDTYRAGIVANDIGCVLVDEMLRRHNYETGSEAGARNVGCVSALKDQILKDRTLCEKIFALCVYIANGGRITAQVFRGLAALEKQLIARKDSASVCDAFCRGKLIAIGMDSLTVECIKAVQFFGKGGELIFARGILRALNDGRKGGRIKEI